VDHPLDGCRAKLDRAHAHLRTLDAQIPAFLDSKPHVYRGEIDREASRYRVRVYIRRQPPLRWSAIVGDLVHNLRSALDHLVWQLVILNGSTPGDNHQFPILSSPQPKKFARLTAEVSPLAAAVIERVQPYNGGDGVDAHTLTALRELSNEDKHRVILPTATAIPVDALKKRGSFELMAARDVGEIEGMEVVGDKPLKNGEEVMSAAIEITGPNPEIQMKGDLPFDVAFGKHMVSMTGLAQVNGSVYAVFELLKPFFD